MGVAAVGLLAVAVLAERPLLGESIHSFTHLQYVPLFWAVVAEIASMISLALLERRILILAGHRLSVGRAVSIAYASNAVAQSLPIVGSGAATAFTYRRMVSHGAEPTLACWTLNPGLALRQHRLRGDHLRRRAGLRRNPRDGGLRHRAGPVGDWWSLWP